MKICRLVDVPFVVGAPIGILSYVIHFVSSRNFTKNVNVGQLVRTIVNTVSLYKNC